MINEYNELIFNLKNKIQEFITLYNKVKEENINLNQERSELLDRIGEKGSEVKELEDKYEKLKLGKALSLSGEDTHNAKVKIKMLVREIDKCIALLNR